MSASVTSIIMIFGLEGRGPLKLKQKSRAASFSCFSTPIFDEKNINEAIKQLKPRFTRKFFFILKNFKIVFI